ncbi:MAG: LemA family protein [bacterium]|nr:LemA family protein [bacterium]
MRKGLSGLLIVAGVVAIAGLMLGGTYNRLVTLGEAVDAQWAQVENQLQRRFDLIPNLVETVRGYAAHERAAIDSVTTARAKLAGGGLSAEDRMAAENELSGALSRLLVVVENYPNLKADANFRMLMDQLEGTENRLAQERRRFNEHVQSYNVTIKRFPTVFLARMFGFLERAYFQVPEDVQGVPQVQF